MGRSGQKLTRLHEAVELGEADDTVWPGAAHEVVRAKLARMVEARRQTTIKWRVPTSRPKDARAGAPREADQLDLGVFEPTFAITRAGLNKVRELGRIV